MRKFLEKLVPRKFSCAALDIGAREIKYISLSPVNGNLELMAAARYPTPPGVFGESFNEEPLVSILERLTTEYGLAGTEVISSIRADRVVTRHITLPRMNHKELNKAVLAEAEKVMPLPLEDLVVQHVILDEHERKGGKEVDVLFAAAPLALGCQYHDMLKRYGITVTALDLPAIALWRLYRKEMTERGKVVAIIEIGEICTHLVITQSGKLKFTRTLPAGGALLTGSMAEMYGMEIEQARAIKEEEGRVLSEADLPGADAGWIQLDLSLRDGLGQLVREIRRSLEFYSALPDARPAAEILLVGGTGKLRGFDIFLGDALSLPVEILRPSCINFAASGEFAFDPSLALACGLALREVRL